MSNTVYPTAIDTVTDPATTDTLASVPHNVQHGLVNDAVVQLETKLGIGASTPVAGYFLVGNGPGSSGWVKSPISPSFSTSILDANGLTWIGQTPTATAVNYINITNNSTTNAPIIAAAGSDTNIDLNLASQGSGHLLVTLYPRVVPGRLPQGSVLQCRPGRYGLTAWNIKYQLSWLTPSLVRSILM